MPLMNMPVSTVRWTRACRLVPSLYPSVGLFDRISAPEDLEAITELEAWTNDRVSTELGILTVLPREEWVVGQPMASVVMAAFCHPRPGGGRFSSADRGAWYAGRAVETSLAESIYHRTRELEEVGQLDTRVQMRLYHADFRATFHDVRDDIRRFGPLYHPTSYTASQQFARELLADGSNGVVYDSVRHAGGECIACFRPKLVLNVRVAAHYEFTWQGTREPVVRRLAS
jgi:RES domain